VAPGASLELLYDFGAGWRFTIKLEKVAPKNAEIKAPKILEHHGKSPHQHESRDGD